jgi:hypothetical protein
MRQRTISLLATAAATALLAALPVGSAMAATGGVLTVGSTGGTNVNVGDALSAALSGTSTFTTSAGNLSCTGGSFASTDKTNPAVSVGTATETVTAISFTGCTSTITGTTAVNSIGLESGTSPVATVTASSSTLSVDPTVAVTLQTIFGPITCYYASTISGALSNTAHTLTFTSQSVARQTGSNALCPSSGSFTATYKPIIDTTQSSKDVYVN